MRGCAVGSQPLKVTYWEVRPTYSAQGGGGNCERGAGRCSAAQSEFEAPRKIFQPKSLIFRLKDFAGMEKVRFLALISCFSASFYCGKEAKTLVGTSPYSGKTTIPTILSASIKWWGDFLRPPRKTSQPFFAAGPGVVKSHRQGAFW